MIETKETDKNNHKIFIYGCMMGQERSPDNQSEGIKRGEKTGLLSGGLQTITTRLIKLYNIDKKLNNIDENPFLWIEHIFERLKKHPEILENFEVNSSHDSYFLKLIRDKNRQQSEEKIFVLSIYHDEARAVQLGINFLSQLGEIKIIDGGFKK